MKKLVGLVVAIILVCTVLVGCYPRPSEDYSWVFDSSQEESSREESSKKSSETRRTFAYSYDTLEIMINIDLVLADKPKLKFEVSKNEDSVTTYTALVDDCLRIELNCDAQTDKIGMVSLEFEYNNATWEDYKCYLESILSILDAEYAYDILDIRFDFEGKEENTNFTYGLDGTVFYAFYRDSDSFVLMMSKKS